MKMVRLFVLFAFFTTWHNLDAQSQFSRRYSFNIPGDLFSSILIEGDSIFISGVSGDTSNNMAEIHASKNLSALFDLEGNEIRHSVYKGGFKKSYDTFFHSLIRTADGGFSVCSGSVDTFGVYHALFIKYNSALGVMMVKEYKYPDSVLHLEEQSMVQLKDGSIIMVGEIQNSLGIGTLDILKIDSAANLIWWKDFDPGPLSYLYPTILILTDTTLLIGCEYSNEVEGPYSITSQTKFMVIDTAGNLLNQWMDSNDSTFAPYGLLKTKDAGYAYCGRYMIKMNAPYDVPLTDGVITKMDSNFHLVWRKLFASDEVYGNEFYQLRELSDGSLIAAGEGVGFVAATNADENTGWFMKVSANGDSIWSRMYAGVSGAENENVINDFQVLPDGGIIGCGVSTDYSAVQYGQQAWLIRLDSMGCLIPGCDTLTATGISPVLIDGSHTGLVVYPNPANDLVYLLIKTDNPNPQLSFKVYDATGKLVAEERGAMPDITYLLHTSHYSNGIYFVRVLNGDGIVGKSRFVKE